MASILGSDLSKGIGQLLREKQLRVPEYQRSYAWKRQQVDDLFQDLRRAIENERDYYFLGSIVGSVAKDDHAVDIVDGQQRLATTTILLAAIRDHLLVDLADADGATRFEDTYLYRTEGIANPTREPRIALNETDNEVFRKRILSRPGSPDRSCEAPRVSHRLIVETARLAAEFVKMEIAGTRPPAEKKKQFDRWVGYLSESARVIFILVPDMSEAYTVFETLNDRGLELTIADLTKNYLFGTAKKRIQEVKESWTRMVATLQASTESEVTKVYIHHLWSSKYGVTREREMFKAIRDKITSASEAAEFSADLANKAEKYTATRSSSAGFWVPYPPTTKTHVNILNHLKVTQIRVLMLAIMDEFAQPEIEKVLPYCVCWSVRFSVAGGSPGNVETLYATTAMKIRAKTIKNANELISAITPAVPNDPQFKAAFAVEDGSPTSKAITRYYLQCLQKVANDETDPHLGEDNEQTGSLEHILPLNRVQTDWTFTDSDAERLVWRLGNLALLDKQNNSKVANKPYSEKLRIYKASPHSLTSEIETAYGSTWCEASIAKRQEKLAELALIAWPLAQPGIAKGRKGKK